MPPGIGYPMSAGGGAMPPPPGGNPGMFGGPILSPPPIDPGFLNRLHQMRLEGNFQGFGGSGIRDSGAIRDRLGGFGNQQQGPSPMSILSNMRSIPNQFFGPNRARRAFLGGI